MLKKAIFILIPLVIIGASTLVFIGLQRTLPRSISVDGKQQKEQIPISPSPTPSTGSTTMKVPAPGYETVQEMIVNTNNDGSDLESILIKEYGSKAQFTIDKSEDGFVQGMITNPGKQAKWWLAVEKSGQWKIVLDGYSYINCKDIAPYNFPSSIVPACWGKNTLINR